MILNKTGQTFEYEGKQYSIGDRIIGTGESEYEGLYGSIEEIRDGKDKETDNTTPDIYCCFDSPVQPDKVKKLEEVFSDLYGEPKKLADIILDSVIMAPDMIEAASKKEAESLRKIDENTYTALLDAGDKLCHYCENNECEKCQVTRLMDDAFNEAVQSGIIEFC